MRRRVVRILATGSLLVALGAASAAPALAGGTGGATGMPNAGECIANDNLDGTFTLVIRVPTSFGNSSPQVITGRVSASNLPAECRRVSLDEIPLDDA